MRRTSKEGKWFIEAFFAHFELAIGPDPARVLGGRGGSTSTNDLAGLVFGVMAAQPVCFEAALRADIESVQTIQPLVQSLHGRVQEFVVAVERSDEIKFKLEQGAWAHVHLRPGCDLPGGVTPQSRHPKQILTADAKFPNGFNARAGPYLNGIFPGPTLSTAAFFGTFSGIPGDASFHVRALARTECVVVVDSTFDSTFFDEPGRPVGYVDQLQRPIV